jgi:hypothetical protein
MQIKIFGFCFCPYHRPVKGNGIALRLKAAPDLGYFPDKSLQTAS